MKALLLSSLLLCSPVCAMQQVAQKVETIEVTESSEELHLNKHGIDYTELALIGGQMIFVFSFMYALSNT